MRLSRPFIRLPFRFDAERLAAKAGQFEAERWMPHPNRLPGNSAIALVSSGGGDNDSFAGAKAPTRHLDACPYTRQAMASFGEVLSRSRLMKLEPGAEVRLHVDLNYHWFSRVRIHIPVVTRPEVIFQCGGEQLHMGAGECWLFDSWRRHRVVNGSALARIHLVVDTGGSSRFWDVVRKAGDAHPSAAGAEARLVAFDPRDTAPLLTERFASLPVMAPGECAALIEDLVADLSANPDNPAALVDSCAAWMRGFAQDWREAWLLHGHSPEGMPRYRELIECARRRLHPDMRALTVASNRMGVNAIFVQRVLNAALAPDARVD